MLMMKLSQKAVSSQVMVSRFQKSHFLFIRFHINVPVSNLYEVFRNRTLNETDLFELDTFCQKL